MCGLAENLHQAAENEEKPVLCLLRANLGGWGLGVHDPFELCHDIHEHLSVLLDRFENAFSPLGQDGLRFAQPLMT